jgi:SH3 domain protein
LVLLSVLLAAPVAMAQTGGRQQYISDEITVSIREQPRNDATVTGALKSGARVTLLESLGEESFARIRTADGREGWITARFLTSQPVARERYLQAKDFAEATKIAAE